MKVVKWILVFIACWLGGTVLAMVGEIGAGSMGYTLTEETMGMVVLICIVGGLIWYGVITAKR